MGERARGPVSLRRAAPGRAPVAEPSAPGWLRALLAAPLTLKLVGANLLVALAALAARVPASMMADRELRRLGRTLNLLLDGLETDRARLRELATQALRAQD